MRSRCHRTGPEGWLGSKSWCGNGPLFFKKAVIIAFPCVSLPFFAVPLRSQPTLVAIRADFLQLQHLPAFAGLCEDITENIDSWTLMQDSNTPHLETLPGKWGEDGVLTSFQRLLILRCIRIDFLVPGTQLYVVEQMGQKFVEPPAFRY
eukprot:SAG22_NODE_187_length_15860_cov_44.770446_20_plen_149_part_00